jgi:hypothetical protein
MGKPVQSQPATANIQQSPDNLQGVNKKSDIPDAIEKLATLKVKDILTDSEYSGKKTELLLRL